MSAMRVLGLLCCAVGMKAGAMEAMSDGTVERIAVHFEAASSRLRPEDAGSIEKMVSRAQTIPGAHLALLVPITTEPAHSRFVAARVSELERRVQSLAETAEYRRIAANSNADVLWLALALPAQSSEEAVTATFTSAAAKPDSEPPPAGAPRALTAPAAAPATSVDPARIRLADWVVRGVKRRPHGPVSAYVARSAPGSAPKEVTEHQTDQEFGLVREISLSADSGWVVRTEIGWIGQNGPSSIP